MDELEFKDNEMIPAANELIPYEDKQVTQLGNLYVERVSDTLHRVKKFEINFFDEDSRPITYEQYDKLSKVLTSPDAPKFIKFKTGDIIAVNQIKSIKAREMIVDTRREDM